MRTADEAISPRLDRVSCRMLRPKHPGVSLTSGGLEASGRIGRGAPTPRSIRYRSAPAVRLCPPGRRAGRVGNGALASALGATSGGRAQNPPSAIRSRPNPADA